MEQFKRVTAGDYEVEAPIKYDDELGLLAANINALAKTLSDKEKESEILKENERMAYDAERNAEKQKNDLITNVATVMGKEEAPCDHKYDVTGSLCENNDKFAIDRMLPKIDMGDILVIHDTGAHGFSMGYNYNGRLWSAEVLLKEDGSFQKIRRAEEPKDYFATLDFTPEYKKMFGE